MVANWYAPAIFLRLQARVVPQRLGGAQAVGVEAHAGAGAARARAAVAQVQRHRAIHVARLHPHRRAQRAALVGQFHHGTPSPGSAFLGTPKLVRGGGAQMAALSQVSLVMGLGSSCSQPLLAKRPS